MIRPLKKRYIGFKVAADSLPSQREVLTLVVTELRTLGYDPDPMLRVRILAYNEVTGVGMLRCDHRSVAKIRDAFHRVQAKSSSATTLRILGVSGTIRALRRKFLRTGG